MENDYEEVEQDDTEDTTEDIDWFGEPSNFW